MKADVVRAHEVEQGMFERNYTSFTLRCKRHRGFSLRMPALPACRLAHGGLSPPARQSLRRNVAAPLGLLLQASTPQQHRVGQGRAVR